ncbi:hypothetical protein SKAU_G00062610 [Synaphobranchus kaupii]|uniref:Uncharacterized protein n=1 Tax=Synaphobranchus kaupii TaxID=118154 RepID=A0A9Q1G647_SYNKA|nr:hypothetical protein SKAU_G00062610 [Synaphobranchus kaupii]
MTVKNGDTETQARRTVQSTHAQLREELMKISKGCSTLGREAEQVEECTDEDQQEYARIVAQSKNRSKQAHKLGLGAGYVEGPEADTDRQAYAEVVARRQKEREPSPPMVRPKTRYVSTPKESESYSTTSVSSEGEEEEEAPRTGTTRLMHGKRRKDNQRQTGPNEYRDQYGRPVNAAGGPLDCPFGNPLCEYGVRGGAGWECWKHHPQAAQQVADPKFWNTYAKHIWGLDEVECTAPC